MKLQRQGQRLVIPIGSYLLSEVRIAVDRPLELQFRRPDADGQYSEVRLRVEEAVTLTRGTHSETFVGSRPGSAFDPRSLAPLVKCVGEEVTEAFALLTGELFLVFKHKLQLSIQPSTGFEAWHLHFGGEGASGGEVLHGLDGCLG